MQLSSGQLNVARHGTGPALVLAGPGSGKTASTTQRAANLIKNKLEPSHLLLVTFSRKAADEMLERVSKLVAVPPKVMTLHKLGLSIIREDPEACGRMRGVSIADNPKEHFRQACINAGITKKEAIDATWSTFSKLRYSKYYYDSKSYALTLERMYGMDAKPAVINKYVEAFNQYEKIKKKKNVIDLTDAILLPKEALASNSRLRQKYGMRFRFIIVDEAQDMSWPQFALIRGISRHNNLMLVGDDDQTIYGFQGADPNILHHFAKKTKAKIMKLEANYRSSPAIVATGDMLIMKNKTRLEKTIFSASQESGYEQPELVCSETHRQFIREIVTRIRNDSSRGIPLNDMAILFRLGSMQTTIVTALEKEGIPYQIMGGTQRIPELEVDAFIYFLRLMLDPFDYTAFRSLGNIYGVMSRTLDKAINKSKKSEDDVDPITACSQINDNRLKSLASEIIGIFSGLQNSTPETFFECLRLNSNFTQCMRSARKRSNQDVDSEEAYEDLLLLQESNIRKFLNKPMIKRLSTEQKLRELADAHFLGDDIDTGNKEGIVVGTIHKSKGLEWASVHVVGISENQLPFMHESVRNEEAQIESERCLAYVAVTRARKHLYMHHTQQLLVNGIYYDGLMPSRFLREMGYLEK